MKLTKSEKRKAEKHAIELAIALKQWRQARDHRQSLSLCSNSLIYAVACVEYYKAIEKLDNLLMLIEKH